MKDLVFAGPQVAEALALAARTLGLAEAVLRYVVLDPGRPAAPGRPAQEARIAVLLAAAPAPKEEAPRAEPRAGIEALVRALGKAAAIHLTVETSEDEEALRVNLEGRGRGFLLADDGAPLRALQHLLQRAYGRTLSPRRLAVDCDGYGEQRREALGRLARELAAAVREDGRPRQTEPLNAYERRLIHLALADAPNLRTFSVGEGSARRVTIAPAAAGTGTGPERT